MKANAVVGVLLPGILLPAASSVVAEGDIRFVDVRA